MQEMQETWVWSLDQEDPLEEERTTTPVFLPEKSSGQRNLLGYSPWGHKEWDTTKNPCTTRAWTLRSGGVIPSGSSSWLGGRGLNSNLHDKSMQEPPVAPAHHLHTYITSKPKVGNFSGKVIVVLMLWDFTISQYPTPLWVISCMQSLNG